METSKEAFKAQVWLLSEYVGGLRVADFVDAEFGVVAFEEEDFFRIVSKELDRADILYYRRKKLTIIQ